MADPSSQQQEQQQHPHYPPAGMQPMPQPMPPPNYYPYRRSSSEGDSNNPGAGPPNYYYSQQQQQQPGPPPPRPQFYQRTNSASSYGPPAYGNTNYGQNCSAVNTTDADQVDSALIAALKEPRERIALLQLETVLTTFMEQDSAGWMEVAGPYNSVLFSPTTQTQPAHQSQQRQTSFQRCVLHRLADRFGIVREPGALLGPGSLRLIKLPHSRVPELKISDIADTVEVNAPADQHDASYLQQQQQQPPPPQQQQQQPVPLPTAAASSSNNDHHPRRRRPPTTISPPPTTTRRHRAK